ncbi:MAG TPA: hypothetical protein PK907_05630 [Candidatus Sabulitectum sp.]|nr:hypothetical protein [Candidatus Sabulitectum sp.]
MKPTVKNFDFSSVEVPDEVKKTVADMLFKQWIEEFSADEACNENNKAD